MDGRKGEKMAIIYKTCTLCREEKPQGCFYKHPQFPDGFASRCKRCATVKNDSKKYKDTKFANAQIKRWGHAKL